jgi:hypothetical protein
VLAETTNASVREYAPEDYVDAFVSQGFTVSVKKFSFDGFAPAPPRNSPYYPTLLDVLTYAADDKLLFRVAKPQR